MISQKDMVGIIATEAAEAASGACWAGLPRRSSKRKEKTVKYNLRLVQKKNGELEWRD